MNMNFDQARFNMVEQQIRPWEVLDSKVLSLLESIHREDFVPVRYRKLAFADIAVPLPCDQVMMRPKIEARMLQELGYQARVHATTSDDTWLQEPPTDAPRPFAELSGFLRSWPAGQGWRSHLHCRSDEDDEPDRGGQVRHG